MAARTFAVLLAAYPPEVRALALGARKLVLDTLPAADERVDASVPVIGYGYGAGYNGLICTLILSKSGVKPLNKPSDLRTPGLKQLMKSAAKAWRERNAEA
jgi:hypothetical protein